MAERISNKIEKINIRALCAMRAGASEALCYFPENEDEVRRILAGDPDILPIGSLTNTLISDGFAKAHRFISLSKLDFLVIEGNSLKAGAGCLLSRVIRETLKRTSLLAPLAGIPGTVGGAAATDCKANGMHFSDLKPQVNRIGGIITSVTIELPENREDGNAKYLKYLQLRKQRHTDLPNSLGSIFRNPEGDYAGRLLEEAGLKGKSIGAAKVSEEHANIFVNSDGTATFEDVTKLISFCRVLIQKLYNIDLELDINIYK